MNIKPSGFSIIIDTDSYSGNFEREMCGYVTGQIGECGVGLQGSLLAQSEIDLDILNWFEENINQVPDDNGCFRPVSITSRKDGKYESVEIFFIKEPSSYIIELIKDRVKKFCLRVKINCINIRSIKRNYKEEEKQL